jgi:hypothetical protein
LREVIVGDNIIRSPVRAALLAPVDARVLRYPLEFNFSKIVILVAPEPQGGVPFHEVDYRLRAGEKGRRVVCTPHATVHYEEAAGV